MLGRRLAEYVEEIADVPRARLRFYDQTGISFMKDLVIRRRRVIPGLPPPLLTAPSSGGSHYSFFGMTSIRPEQPPVYYTYYETSRENGQDATEHTDFMASAWEHGALVKDYDVIIHDNWSAHTGADGTEVRDALEDHGITMVPLPVRFSNLNGPIEMSWRTAKARARTHNAWIQNLDPLLTPHLLELGLKSISHGDMASLYNASGYRIEPRALDILIALGML